MTDIGALSGLQILVVGLGREGVALASYLARHGLSVVATDRQPEEKIPAAADLRAAGVSLVLGHHPAHLLDQAHLLFVSPGIPLEIPFLEQARAKKLPLSTESRLFCHLCPAPIIGITGSSGKTTTTTLVGKILEADGQRKVWVGGNIGHPLISYVDEIGPDDLVVLELSSFQLEYFHARLNRHADLSALPAQQPQALARLLDNWSPALAALLNITPNHLDRHPSMKQYVRAKRALINYQQPDDRLVLSLDNDMTRTIGYQFAERVRWFSLEAQVPGGAGVVNKELVMFDDEESVQPIVPLSDVKLRGPHNLSNILAACLLTREVGVSLETMRQVITTFKGVAHRLQLVRDLNGVTYIDDSISTSPERLIAALRSFTEPVVLLAGGYDKNLPWDDAARHILTTVKHAILFGKAAGIIEAALERMRQETAPVITTVHRCETLAQAVDLAVDVAQPGSVVLLSPGCASYDQFKNFEERGEAFKSLVSAL